jgi:hypothetical protein
VHSSFVFIQIDTSSVSIIVDGDVSDWDFSVDNKMPMFNAGNGAKEEVAYAYTRSNCVAKILCICVHMKEGYTMASGAEWYKDYGLGNGEQTGTIVEIHNAGGEAVGWEGCFATSETDIRSIEIHANYNGGDENGNTGSTGRVNGEHATLDLSCSKNYVLAEADLERASGGSFGDPHFKTWTGHIYDFHGKCDLILIKSGSFHHGKGLEIQIRTELCLEWSFIAHAAIKIGDEVLQVGSHGMFALNGVAGAQLKKKADLPSVGGFPVKYFHYGSDRQKFEIDIGDKQKVVVKVYNQFLAVAIDDAEEEDFGDAVGLMGHFHTGKVVGRKGDIMTDAMEIGSEWQVRDTETMLFTEVQEPQYPTHCSMPSPKAIELRKRRLSESMVSYDQAEKACAAWVEAEAREACMYDVLATGDLRMADAGVM